MTWTAPMTAVAFEPFSAAQYNTHIRDNLLETGVAKAVGPDQYLVSAGVSNVAWRQAKTSGTTNTNNTSSTSYTSIGGGFEVGLQTGEAALVLLSASLWSSTSGASALMSYEIAGATDLAASDDRCLMATQTYTSGTYVLHMTRAHLQIGLNPGFSTFLPRYRAEGGTASFTRRSITVIPF